MSSLEYESWRSDVRYTGKGAPEEKEAHRSGLAETFHGKKPELVSEEEWVLVKKLEKEKSSQERAAIRIANDITNETRKKYGLDSFDIPEQNFLFLPDNAYEKVSGGIDDEEFEVATSDTEHQRMYFRDKIARLFPIHAAQAILHEITHHKGVMSFEAPEQPVMEDNQLKTAIPHREGLAAYSHSSEITKKREHEHFLGLDEAIVETYTMRHTPELLEAPEFASEREWSESEEAWELKDKIAQRENIPAEEIAWAARDGEWQPYSYRVQRAVLQYCAEEIAKEFPEEFRTKENVIDRFIEGTFVSGRMLSLGRFVEKTFGKDSFRMLGEMSNEKDETDPNKNAVLILEKLRNARQLIFNK